MATLGLEFSYGRAWGAQEVEGREECPYLSKAGEEFSLLGAVVYARELLEQRIRTPQLSAEFALLTTQGLFRTQMSRIRE